MGRMGGAGHEAVLAFPTVLVGAGEIGAEVELPPEGLIRLTGATVRRLPSPVAAR